MKKITTGQYVSNVVVRIDSEIYHGEACVYKIPLTNSWRWVIKLSGFEDIFGIPWATKNETVNSLYSELSNGFQRHPVYGVCSSNFN
jgi:hypothetical protein